MRIGRPKEGEETGMAFTWLDVCAFVIALVLTLIFLFGTNVAG